jgi:Abortive infection alpha
VADDPLDPAAQARRDAQVPDRDREDESNRAAAALEVAPLVARLAAGAAWRTAGWTVGAYARGMNWLTRAALSDESTAELLNEARADLRDQVRGLLGFDEIEERLMGGRRRERRSNGGPERDPLRQRGYELLERSADVEADEDAHPAYERILTQLAPDEARILRLLATKGAQPAVDVKTWRPLGVGSQTVAPGLSMIGAEAGCRYPDRVPAYLNNLFRLGLVWFSREPLDDPRVYQVLEAQPDVIEASKRAGRASTVRRSIHLTPFGIDFCETCLPLSTPEFEELESARPAEGEAEGD